MDPLIFHVVHGARNRMNKINYLNTHTHTLSLSHFVLVQGWKNKNANGKKCSCISLEPGLGLTWFGCIHGNACWILQRVNRLITTIRLHEMRAKQTHTTYSRNLLSLCNIFNLKSFLLLYDRREGLGQTQLNCVSLTIHIIFKIFCSFQRRQH